MHFPYFDSTILGGNRLLMEELTYDCATLAEESVHLTAQLIDEQRVVYDTIMEDALTNGGGEIVLNVASSDIASLLLLGGRTAHSRVCKLDCIIGDQNDGYVEVEIPQDMLLSKNGDPITTIVEDTFPMFFTNNADNSFLERCAILTPTLDVVNAVNQYMSDIHVAETRTYLSCDTVCRSESNDGILTDVHTPEFLNGIRASGIPNQSLTLKVRLRVMLLRNIDHSLGLCNGTRLIVTQLSEHVVEAKISTGDHSGTRVLVPRMSITPSDPRLPFKFKRRQFPLMLSYAMTINKSQGQTLSHVGLLMKKPVFVHGQLYVAAFIISNPKGLKFMICNELDNKVSNS
ncbi:uncharacterized protein LOC115996083 [Ipomoea triloba]|uniref:uncharacterized protein LOC115996083 n=1 Tax=Ipomoea triloba TaxID=35885 RepID=UPI00125E7873|nr:uncharacterized protein LOC115996083 [Ipomoea triloba]